MRTAAAPRLLIEARGDFVRGAVRPPAAEETRGTAVHRAHDVDRGIAHAPGHPAHGASDLLETAFIRVRHEKLLQLMHDDPELHRLGLCIAIELTWRTHSNRYESMIKLTRNIT